DRRVVRVLVDRGEDALDRRAAGEGAAAPVDVRAELVGPVPHVARDRIDGEVAERAEGAAEDAAADRLEQVEVGVRRLAALDLLEQLDHPARPLAAGRALAAGL